MLWIIIWLHGRRSSLDKTAVPVSEWEGWASSGRRLRLQGQCALRRWEGQCRLLAHWWLLGSTWWWAEGSTIWWGRQDLHPQNAPQFHILVTNLPGPLFVFFQIVRTSVAHRTSWPGEQRIETTVWRANWFRCVCLIFRETKGNPQATRLCLRLFYQQET